ncbi:hypothetical protein EPI10_001405 [Gossypium australe]|uniref:Uncharacterized protein n=1 Tax=Gossypium australe TaxID=47621 RepID=A0A5B6VBC1_9ROSI|nr:hypothetical protein EPI10_001405 [Gossypium australe]
MEECQALGLTKSLGVSNLSCKKLQTILSTAKIPPAKTLVSLTGSYDELHKISQLPKCKVYAAGDFVSDDGPHKTVEEFWDGEI